MTAVESSSRPRIPALQSVRYELAGRRFSDFVKQAWSVLEPGTELRWNWHLDVICQHLELVTAGEIKKLIINIPPGHAKSLLVSVFWPAWQYLHKPDFRAVFASYNSDLSNRDSQRCRQLVRSDWYAGLKEHLGITWELSGDQSVKSYWKTTATGERLAVAVKGKITGFRGDAVVVDDPHLIKVNQKVEELDEVATWFDKVLSTRLNDQASGIRILIMQRVHTADLTGHLLEKYGDKYVHLCLPSRYEADSVVENPYFTDPRTEEGECLFPDKYGEDVLETLEEELGPQDFAGQFQQQPVAMAGGHFNGGTFKFWYPPGFDPEPVKMIDAETDEQVECEQVPLEIEHGTKDWNSSWDCAFKGTTSSDPVVGQVWGRLKDKPAHLVLIDSLRGRWTFGQTCDRIKSQIIKHPRIRRVYVEDAANGAAVVDSLEGTIPGIKAVKPQGGKISRANAVMPMFESGQIYFPHPQVFPWVRELLKEMLKFPKGKNDDQVDAATQAITKMRNRVTILI